MATSYPLTWDDTGERFFEMGVSKVVLFHYSVASKAYDAGVAWNGVTSISDSPEGADATDLWADNIKYATLRSTEKSNGSIEAYTYPDEFEPCDGVATPVPGVKLHQQKRDPFGLCYRTEVGNDEDSEMGYKLHFVWGATASPSDRSYDTINDSPDVGTLSWDFETTPVNVAGYKPISTLVIDSRTADAEKLAALEKIVYGDGETESKLPLPAEIITTMTASSGS